MTDTSCPDEIPRLEGLTRQRFVDEYLRFQQPFVLTEESSTWPAVRDWSLDHLAMTHHDHEVLVEYYPSARRSDAYTYTRMTVGEYIHRVQSEPEARRRFYLADTSIESTLPRLKDDVGIPSVIESTEGLRTGLFFGFDTFSATHYHRFCEQALLVQISGCKEVSLYPAKQLSKTSPHPWYGLRTNFSRIEMEFDTHREQAERHMRITPLRCILQPGEMLFIPDHWMHTVAGPGENISLTYFWPESLRHCYVPGVARDLLSSLNKTTLLAAARIGRRLGIQDSMLNLAIRLGVVPDAEREAVEQHLDEFSGHLPNQVKTAGASR
ncbi:MAG: cupin-like domain-containing protein [Planctomycetota bacterium]